MSVSGARPPQALEIGWADPRLKVWVLWVLRCSGSDLGRKAGVGGRPIGGSCQSRVWSPSSVFSSPVFAFFVFSLLARSLARSVPSIVLSGGVFLLRTSYPQTHPRCIGFGSFAGIVSLRFQKIHELLGPHERPLEYYACIFGFITKWHNVSRRCSTLVLSMWAFSSICQVGEGRREEGVSRSMSVRRDRVRYDVGSHD